MSMSIPIIGMVLGLILGIIWVAFSFDAALLVGFLTFIGWGIGTMIERRINVTEVWGSLQERWH
jgi:uncharacterized membrane protein